MSSEFQNTSAQEAQQCLRDIVALSTLPAVWSGADPVRIAESLAAAIFATLDAVFVYVYFTERQGRSSISVAQIDRYQTSPSLAESHGRVLYDWSRAHDPDELLTLPHPPNASTLQVTARSLGHESEWGVIAAAFPKERPPTPSAHLILNVAATQAAIAIQNAHLVRSLHDSEERVRKANSDLTRRVEERTRELTQSQEQLRALAAELNLTEQRERQRLATDLHDYLGQLLALSRMKLGQARQQSMPPPLAKILAEVLDVTDNALAYTRTLISQLSPPILHEFGLPMALQWLAEQMHQRNLAVVLEIKPDFPPLPEELALLLFQSTRELLINCAKHAQVREAAVVVEEMSGWLRITVSDQGKGFDLSAVALRARSDMTAPGFGLFSTRERMLSLGGRFEIQTGPGKGTLATLVVPITPRVGPSSSPTMEEPEVRPNEPFLAHRHVATNNGNDHGAAVRVQPAKNANGTTIRVLVADDHAMVRQGLCGLLKEYTEIHVIGEAANGEEAVALAHQLEPDVVLMDITMPKLDGIEATRLIKRKYPAMVVIGLSVHTAGQVEAAMREAGAAAFLNKEVAVDQLYQAIHQALAAL